MTKPSTSGRRCFATTACRATAATGISRSGYNYRLTNLQAAVGTAQMERVEAILQRKRALAERYTAFLAGIPGMNLPPRAAWADPVCWLYTLRIDAGLGLTRDELAARLLLNGIETRPVFEPLHRMPPFERFARGADYPVTDRLAAGGLSLPSAVTLEDADVDAITSSLRAIVGVRHCTSPPVERAERRMRYRAAIVGLGQVGMLFDDDPKRRRTWTHFSAYERLTDRFDLVAVCDPDAGPPGRRAPRAPRRADVRALDDLLDAEPLDVVSLCTPIALHAEQVEACAPQVRAIVCEKPLSATLPPPSARRLACAHPERLSRRQLLQALRSRLSRWRTG